MGSAMTPMRGPMTPAQITRAICMRRYAWGKSPQQIADESGLAVARIIDVIAGRPFSEAVKARLEGYIRTPAGPSALIQDNDKGKKVTSMRFFLLRRIIKLSRIGKQFGIVTNTGRTKEMDEGAIRTYFYWLDDTVKTAIMKRWPRESLKYKLADSAPAWEWIERLEKLQNAQRPNSGETTQRSHSSQGNV
jgi:hypothetical protein